MAARKRKDSAEAPSGVPARTLIVTASDGEYKITIPKGARITFGPTIPFVARKGTRDFGGPQFNPGGGYSIRIYATAQNDSLIAVFADVQQFRDIEIPRAKLIIRETGKSVWKSDETGYETQTEVKHDAQWEKQLTS